MAIFSHERCFNSLLSLHSDSTHFVTLCGSILCLFCKIKPVRTLDVDFIIQWCMDITRSLTIGPKAQARKFPLFLSPDSSLKKSQNCSSGWGHCSFFTQEPFTTSTENMVLWQEICRLIQPRRTIQNILQTLKHSPSREMTPIRNRTSPDCFGTRSTTKMVF